MIQKSFGKLLRMLSYESNILTWFRSILSSSDIHGDMGATWVHQFDPETKTETMFWKRSSTPLEEFPVASYVNKVMTAFFDYTSKGQTLLCRFNPKNAWSDWRKTWKAIIRVLFHHDNAPAHRSEVVFKAIRNAGFSILDHAFHLTQLASRDIYLFWKPREHIQLSM